jgi:hypothetical protein
VVEARGHRLIDNGEMLVLTAAVRNLGAARSVATSVAVSAPGWPDANEPVDSLAPKAVAQTISLRIAVPEAQRGRTSTFTLRVNPKGNVRESNPNNDTASVLVAVPAPAAVPENDAGGWPWTTIALVSGAVAGGLLLLWFLARLLLPRAGEGVGRLESRKVERRRARRQSPFEDLRNGRSPGAEEEYTDESVPSPAVPERTVSTGFSSPGSPLDALASTTALRPDSDYLFWLEIGPPVPESIESVPTLLPAELPADALLDVVVYGAGLTPTPGEEAGQLRLKEKGALVEQQATKVSAQAASPESSHMSGVTLSIQERRLFFNVRTPSRPSLAQLRCNIYHGQVLVQSRIISAQVRTDTQKTGRLTSELDYTLAPSLSPRHLGSIPSHRLSILLNRTERGTHLLTFKGEEDFSNSAEIDMQALQQAIDIARHALRRVAWGTELEWNDSDVYAYSRPDPNRLERDLISLGLAGFRLYAALADQLSGGAEKAEELERLMLRPGLVQIALKGTSRRLLPAALFYDYRGLHANLPLETYALCQQFKEALANQQPLEECACFAGDCPARGERALICPSGFWGYRHRLGLPVSIATAPDAPSEIAYQGLPSMTLGVATDLADQETHAAAIRQLLAGGEVAYADSFEELLDAFRSGSSAIVYLYCHGGLAQDAWPYVRVGPEGEPVLTADILFSERIRWQSPRPLVFINGCRSVAVEPDKVVELVGALVGNAHAAGVIGTEITVFEPMATVFGVEYLQRFLRGVPVGEAVRAARLTLLQQGNPLGLVYVPFALASLRLAAA